MKNPDLLLGRKTILAMQPSLIRTLQIFGGGAMATRALLVEERERVLRKTRIVDGKCPFQIKLQEYNHFPTFIRKMLSL